MSDQINSGIRCDVGNCMYNNGCNCCTARQVQVKCCHNSTQETMCGTFREG